MRHCFKQMKEKYKVSVVIPVYNSQKYLGTCLETVISQTLKEIQIICIDDNSTDSSLEILNKYSENYVNVSVLHTEHKGASNARNLGFSYTEGEYVIFLDSDDIFEKDMLEELYTSAKVHDADIAICEYNTEFQACNYQYLENALLKYMRQYSEQAFRIENLPTEGLSFWGTASWNKLIKKTFLVKNKIFFQNLRSANDVYFTNMSMILAERIIHTKSFRPMIHYRKNIYGQISNNRNVIDVYKAFEKIYIDINKHKMIKAVYKQYYLEVFHHMILAFEGAKDDEEKREFYKYFSEYGIKKIGLDYKQEKIEIGSYKKLTDYFKNYSYESQWYYKELILSLQLEEKGLEEINTFCSENRVVVWGAGKRGIAVIEVFKKNQINFVGIIDNNEKKQGEMILGVEIQSYKALSNSIDTVIVTNKEHIDSICRSIYNSKKRGMKIFPLFVYLDSELPLDDCIFKIDNI